MARQAAWKLDTRFGQAFDQGTYLADGKTLAVAYYRDLLSEAEI